MASQSPSNSSFGPKTTYTTTYESRKGPDGKSLVVPVQTVNPEEKGFYLWGQNKDTAPIGWMSFEEQAKEKQKQANFYRDLKRDQERMAGPATVAGDSRQSFLPVVLPTTGQPYQSSASDRVGFSDDFLSHIRMARDLSRQQRAADVTKTTSETQKMMAMTRFEQALMSAQAASAYGSAEASRASAGLSQAQASRVSALTPYEIAEMRAQTGLLGAQSGKLFADIATEWGITPTGMANIGLTQAQAGKVQAETASEYGYTAPAQANINLTKAQAEKYRADTAGTYGSAAPNFSNAMAGSTYFGGGPQITSSVIAPPATSARKRFVTYPNGAKGWQFY
jgi:hypothetical protein